MVPKLGCASELSGECFLIEFCQGLSLTVGFGQAVHAHRTGEKSVSYCPALQPSNALPHRQPLLRVSHAPLPRYSAAYGFWFLFSSSQVPYTTHIVVHLLSTPYPASELIPHPTERAVLFNDTGCSKVWKCLICTTGPVKPA